MWRAELLAFVAHTCLQTADNITKWNQVQEELKEELSVEAPAPESSAAAVCRDLAPLIRVESSY